MKAVILAGGLGTRLAEETEVRPKPMVDIGGKPILWHIMKHLAHHGLNEVTVALGYKGEYIKRWFHDAVTLNGSLTIDFDKGIARHHGKDMEGWVVHLMETGLPTNTGGRLRRLRRQLGEGPFLCTYGDGVSDVDVKELIKFHEANGKLATITAVRPPARYGGLYFDGPLVSTFTEKPQAGEGWINGGFMVLEPEVLERIEGDSTSFESDVLTQLAQEKQLAAFKHPGFWQCMDTIRDKKFLESLWADGQAPWKVW
ncbi:MAG: glucose-1-phosphate cytidylyltransferase [Archangiaceae bacterium]|nr:glucose-1-phosphate cytidylyltransferase [Archangiaceae bacterium]